MLKFSFDQLIILSGLLISFLIKSVVELNQLALTKRFRFSVFSCYIKDE